MQADCGVTPRLLTAVGNDDASLLANVGIGTVGMG